MIKLEYIETFGWEAAIRGMRNPKNSWDNSDSGFGCTMNGSDDNEYMCKYINEPSSSKCCGSLCYDCGIQNDYFIIGPKDLELAKKLIKAGSDHRKFMRMIHIQMDVTAPLYWWKDYDTYKIGTVANGCSTMHMIHSRELTEDDFSFEQLMKFDENMDSDMWSVLNETNIEISPYGLFKELLEMINKARVKFVETGDKKYWWQMIQLLPSSYNQKRTIDLNYETLIGLYKNRHNHKLDEWKDFCSVLKEVLPYSELFVGEE